MTRELLYAIAAQYRTNAILRISIAQTLNETSDLSDTDILAIESHSRDTSARDTYFEHDYHASHENKRARQETQERTNR
jgi:hypothetical protein